MRENTKRNILLCAAAKGSFWTRLSFFIMGTGCIRYKQYVRGLIYLLTQIGFFCFLKNFALQYLSKFSTLGTETQRKVWNEDLQIYQRFPGDNSMLILLYSVLSLAVIAVFLYIWYANIRDSWHAQENLREGRKIPSFRDDLHSLTHGRFHITLLSMPMLTLVLFTLLPIIFMILIAFTNFDADHQPPGNLFTWVGMTNVTDIFLGNEMKSYLSLIPISAKVHRRQNRMTLLCIVFAVFLVTAVFSMAEMGARMEYTRLVGKHGNLSMSDLLGSYMGQTLLPTACVLFLLILIAGVLMISSSLNSTVAQRIEFFGMMRCIGMSKQQIVRFVRLEALNWCKTAVPIGLALGTVTTWGLCAVLRFLVGEEFSYIRNMSITEAINEL